MHSVGPISKIEIVSDYEDEISTPTQKLDLDRYPDISVSKAWELANLVRIAGKDYDSFNKWFNRETTAQEFVLEDNRTLEDASENSWLYVDKKIAESTIKEYTILDDATSRQETTKQNFPDDNFFKYKILKTYEFLSFYPFSKRKVDIDRFGFIAEREVEGKKLIFILFRGTREPSEWFNNAQFRQVGFLEVEGKSDRKRPGLKDCGKISQGFNKMYTEFRPGILNQWGGLNSLLRNFDALVRAYLREKGRSLSDKSIVEAISEFYRETDFENADIYISGHSLGGALASVATLDLVSTNLGFEGSTTNGEPQGKIKSPINLYTFASPRVGDNVFADKFNDCILKKHIKAFRFSNSEDLVTNVPFPVWFRAGIDLDGKLIAATGRAIFNSVTGGIFEKDYQHVGMPVYFTHQAQRYQALDANGQPIKDVTGKPLTTETASLGDNHNLTASYCGALPQKE